MLLIRPLLLKSRSFRWIYQRAKGLCSLAHLLGSLSSVPLEEHEAIAEALRHDSDLDAHPSLGISLEQLDQQMERRRS